MRCRQRDMSARRTASAITGLQVAPTAPQPIAYLSSDGVAESFHKQVGVDSAIDNSGRTALLSAAKVFTMSPAQASGRRSLNGRAIRRGGRPTERCPPREHTSG